jgi:hypothetical protein
MQCQAKREADVALGEIVDRWERIRPAVRRCATCGAYSTSEQRNNCAPAGWHDGIFTRKRKPKRRLSTVARRAKVDRANKRSRPR